MAITEFYAAQFQSHNYPDDCNTIWEDNSNLIGLG